MTAQVPGHMGSEWGHMLMLLPAGLCALGGHRSEQPPRSFCLESPGPVAAEPPLPEGLLEPGATTNAHAWRTQADAPNQRQQQQLFLLSKCMQTPDQQRAGGWYWGSLVILARRPCTSSWHFPGPPRTMPSRCPGL